MSKKIGHLKKLWKKNGCAVNFIILYYLYWCIIILETLKMESKM